MRSLDKGANNLEEKQLVEQIAKAQKHDDQAMEELLRSFIIFLSKASFSFPITEGVR